MALSGDESCGLARVTSDYRILPPCLRRPQVPGAACQLDSAAFDSYTCREAGVHSRRRTANKPKAEDPEEDLRRCQEAAIAAESIRADADSGPEAQ